MQRIFKTQQRRQRQFNYKITDKYINENFTEEDRDGKLAHKDVSHY